MEHLPKKVDNRPYLQTLRTASEMAITIEVGDAMIAVKLRNATTGSAQRADVIPTLVNSRP
jgi:hypothetical protein